MTPATAPAAPAARAGVTGEKPADAAPPGAGPPDSKAFASELDHHVARTATAEGQTSTAQKKSGPRQDDLKGSGAAENAAALMATALAPATAASVATVTAPVAAPTDPASSPADPAALPAPAVAAPLVAAATPDASAAAQPAAADHAAAQTTDPSAAPALPTSATPAQTGGADPLTPLVQALGQAPAPAAGALTGKVAETPTPAQAADATATAPSPTTDAQAPAAPAAPQHAGDQVNAAPHALTAAGQDSAASAQTGSTGTGAQPNGQDQPATPPVAALATAAVHKGHGINEPASSAPAGTTAAADPALSAGSAAGDVAAPGAPVMQGAAAPGQKPVPAPVNLQRTVDAVTATIELAARQGTSQARIQLSPASLGALNIHLQKTSDGLIARVVADHSAAAQTLQQGADDLRRSLESAGVTVLRLDIETAGQGAAQAGHDSSAGSGKGSGSSSSSDPTATAADDAAPLTTTIDLGTSTLVNVLA